MPITAVPRGPCCSSLAWRVLQADKAALFRAESVGKHNDWPLILSVRGQSRAGLPVSILTCHACHTDKQTVLSAHALTAGRRRGIARLHCRHRRSLSRHPERACVRGRCRRVTLLRMRRGKQSRWLLQDSMEACACACVPAAASVSLRDASDDEDPACLRCGVRRAACCCDAPDGHRSAGPVQRAGTRALWRVSFRHRRQMQEQERRQLTAAGVACLASKYQRRGAGCCATVHVGALSGWTCSAATLRCRHAPDAACCMLSGTQSSTVRFASHGARQQIELSRLGPRAARARSSVCSFVSPTPRGKAPVRRAPMRRLSTKWGAVPHTRCLPAGLSGPAEMGPARHADTCHAAMQNRSQVSRAQCATRDASPAHRFPSSSTTS
jgi:hypothetical protein